ncbi:MAG: GNAT family N-acetyltransferase [Proteobacteria bacterium]|jgi:[ribosomal protein S5]-alanine N-acetyltransferase|nr:GNAT family N-acetyltransferase [Pseudomonadota bacterium]
MFKLKEEKRLFVMPNFEMRNFDIKDALGYYELYNAPQIAKYLPSDMIPKDITASAEQISYLFLRGRSVPYWAIVDSSNDDIVGSCGFVNADLYNKRLEIAYDLHPKFWGKGVMHNSIKVCLKHAFEKMSVKRVEAVALRENVESAKTLLRIGFIHEGTLRNYKYFRGRMVNMESFSFTFEDYQKLIVKNV